MTQHEYEACWTRHAAEIEQIRQEAYQLHDGVGQTYGDGLPYGYHLDMVVAAIHDYGHLVCQGDADVVPLVFGGYYHDSIEDARLSYNDVMAAACRHLSDDKALLATEIVYALTNEKGRTRAERAGDRYYDGIRQTPYAPFVKLCDRLANVTYSCASGRADDRMRGVYAQEMPHFLAALKTSAADPRLALPAEVVAKMEECLA
ncbi:MAG: hypothetical protein IJ637_01285 [Prevotella sp.]|nr:hypothetical protein [Prevotella sp.]